MIKLLEYEFGLGRGLTTVKCTIISLICIIYCLPFRQVLVVKQIFNAGKASSLMVSRLFTSALHIPILLLQRKQARWQPIPMPFKHRKYMFVGGEGILIAVVLKKNLMQYVPDSFSIKSKRNVIFLRVVGESRKYLVSPCLGMKKHTVVASK